MDIHSAALIGDLSALKDAIKRGKDVNSVNKDGRTPLYWAASYGHTDCVKKLLSSGAVVDLADMDGDTPLMRAANGGYTDCVKKLLSSGAVVDLANKDGDTPLMRAAFWEHEDTVKELLSSGASPLCTNNDGQTALMVAKRSQFSNPSVIQLLEEAAESHLCLQSVPVLPKNWTVVTDTETKKPVYQNKAAGETLSTPPGYPLHQTSAYPDVTFYDMPQEKEFTSSGGHADFDNGVQVTVSANAVPAGTSVSISVQPSLASNDVFVMPEGIQSASPSYLISGEGLNGEVTLSMEHHVRVSTQQEADDLLFLQADSSPKRSGSKSIYQYQVQEGGSKAEFTPGGNTGRLTRRLSKKKFFKVGARIKKWFRGSSQLAASQPDDPPEPESPPNLYTVRVYRSPPHTTEDRMALVIVSYFHRLFFDFLQRFEVVVIPREYPHLSSSPADKTIKQPLCFVQVDAVLELVCDPAWRSVPDQRMISQDEVDLPVIGKFSPEELQCYPPRIVCRFFPEQGAVSCTTCNLSLHGFDKPVSVDMALLTPQRSVDTKQLKEATEVLRRTVGEMTTSQLGSTVETVLSLMEKMTTALQSSSLSELTAYTDSIRTEIKAVLVVTRRVVQECTVQSISENMGASLSKMETLSHQLCHVTKVKLRYCLDQSEETAALVDLVENGANLLRAVDCLLRDIHTLSGVSGPSAKRVTLQELVEQYNLTDEQLNSEIEDSETPEMASCFDDVDLYSSSMGLGIADQADVKRLYHSEGTRAAMMKCLQIWKERNPFQATYRALLDIALRLGKGDTAHQICQQLIQRNAGYSVLVSCSEKIVQSLSEDPKALALHLLSAGLITVSILEKTNEYVNETKREKATRLYTALLGVVKHHPHKYHEFVSTLRLNPLHTDLVTQLDSKYT
ncbi:uncharacterized protein LOC135333968 isoform X2 [Halichondria panicea]|uniref:uncharacterized protein LOC135333968 isoform X2 n=1 Tax=Halichondria panicea TaxID=6063 RepID=UPI00312BBCB3